MIREIVRIDQDLCDGCGQCLPNCVEGALQIVDGKARLLKDEYCDGLGACLGHCPQGAISIIEREANAFDEAITKSHLNLKPKERKGTIHPTLDAMSQDSSPKDSALEHWPIQLNLVPVEAPFFEGCDLLVMADCVPVAYPHLHNRLLSGRSVVIGCPKFDDVEVYVEKLGEILKRNSVRSILVTHMEVPCCSGLNWIVDRAVAASGKPIPVERHVITIKGDMK